jgi:hypothetical protein
MKKLLLIITSLFVIGCSYQPLCCFNGEDVTNMYAHYVGEWQKEAKSSFESAEKTVFQAAPKPDEILGPNPDVSKCICRGSGIIVQGDGHKTPCPYHHKGDVLKAPSSANKK